MDDRLKVVATVGMVGDLVRRVGGDRLRTVTLMRDGVDPHLYKASPRDVAALTSADLVFYSGLHLEGKLAAALAKLARTRRVVAVTDSIPRDRLLKADDGHDTPDPHVWFDVALWARTTEAIERALAEADPAHADGYARRAAATRASLLELDAEVKAGLASIPRSRRVLVTAHDAFRYFGRAYDVEVVGLQGISTESESGVADVNALVELVVSRRIGAVFFESSVSDRSVKALIEGAAARGHRVVIGGELFSDAPGPDGSAQGTYPGMIRHNLETIVAALKPEPGSSR